MKRVLSVGPVSGISGLIFLLCLSGCSRTAEVDLPDSADPYEMSLSEVAKMLSELPLGSEQLGEVRDAVNSSSGNGYDEEYMMSDLLSSPGSGVGDSRETKSSKAGRYAVPLKDLIAEYLAGKAAARSGFAETEEPDGTHLSRRKGSVDDVSRYLNALAGSGAQIYWPYSEDWDGETFPIVTFDPGHGAGSNYGYEISYDRNGFKVVDSVLVDEDVARSRPVWVINRNDDSAFSPAEMFIRAKAISRRLAGRVEFRPEDATCTAVGRAEFHTTDNPRTDRRMESVGAERKTAAGTRILYLRSFRMLRNYDSWFGGASEFRIQIGAVDGFKASTESELANYYPKITDFTLVVKRKYLDVDLSVNSILLTDFTNQLDRIAFLVTEDDGGTRTSWKCSATVKIQSKAYGFDLDIPYNDKDDIVWRGQLAAGFFQEEDEVTGRFGDVEMTFALE